MRELLPRLYVEAALLPIHFFLNPESIKQIVTRLVSSNRGIGDYINAMYFGTFMLRIGQELIPKEKEHILILLHDFFYYMKQGSTFSKPPLSSEEYMELFQPFIVTAFKYYSNNCSQQEFQELFDLYKTSN